MAAISKEEYLKRYLSGSTSSEKKKKRKKVKAVKHTKSKIIDDDIDLKAIGGPATNEETESEDEAPAVAAIVDERPEHVKRLEEYRKDQRWKVLGKKEKDDLLSKEYGVITSGQNSRLHLRHDSDSDASPPRKKRHDSDSDASPPRKKRHDSDSDASPPRKKRHDSDSDASPPRKKRHDSDSDASPPRRKPHDADTSPPRKKQQGFDVDVSSHGKRQHDSDASPPRRKRHDSDSDVSPPRKRRHDSNSDSSPARQKRQGGNSGNISPKPEMGSNKNPSRRQERKRPSRFAPAEPQKTAASRHDSDSDESPQRKQRHDSGSDQSPVRRQRHDSDQSPPRRQRQHSDSDHSPKRRQRHSSDQSPKRRQRHDGDSDQSPPRQRKTGKASEQSPRKREGSKDTKPLKTLGGAKAGLSSAGEMREEAFKLRKREEENFSKIERGALGRDAATVFRDKSGKRRNLAAEKEEELKEAQKKAVEDKKYEEWGRGLKQKELREQTMENYVHEASKPLARYKDDQDLDRVMREMERDGDPMAMFLKKKKSKKEDMANEKPRYRGPAPPPNRFQIMPGYRWDGVDRSNGFEKQIFNKMSEKKAVKEHAYKWSTEDM